MNNVVTIGLVVVGAVSVAVLLYYFWIKPRGRKQDDATVAVVGLTDIQASSHEAEEREEDEPEKEPEQNLNVDEVPLFTPLQALVRAKPLR